MALHWTIASMPMSLLHRGTQNWTQYPRCGLASVEGKVHLPRLAGSIQDTVCLFATMASCWCSPWSPPGLLAPFCKAAFSWVDPSVCRCMELSSPGAGLYTSFAWTAWGSAHYSLSAHFSSLWRSLQTAVWPSGVSAALPSSVSSENLHSLHTALSSKSLLKMLNRAGCWGTRLVLPEFLRSTWYSSTCIHGSFNSALIGREA